MAGYPHRSSRSVATLIAAAGRLSTRNTLLALFVASFLVRAIFLVAVTGLDYPLEGDEGGYHGVAASFLRGDGWEDPAGRKSYLPPLISIQLLLVHIFAGPDPVAARWAMVLFSSLVAPVLFLVTRKLFVGRNDVALLAAAAWVLYPPSIYYASRLLTETTAALLVVGGLGAFLWTARTKSSWPALLTGTLWGLSALNRPVFLLLPLALLVAQLALSRVGQFSWSWSWRRWALGLAAFVLVMAPWTVRNYVEHGVFMPTHSGGGVVLMISNGTLTDPKIQAGYYDYPNPQHERILAQARSELERDAMSRRLAVDEIKKNWRLLPRPILNRAKNFWTTRPDPYDPTWTRNDTIMLLFWGPVLVFFLTSSFTRSWRQNWPALVIVLYAFLLTLPFWGTPRFRFPVDAIVIAGATMGFVELLRLASSTLRRRHGPEGGQGSMR